MFGRRQNAAPDTFGTEVLGYLEPLYATAMRLTRNRADAEDLVQDTVVKALRFQSRFERGTNLRAWLYTILHNTWRNRVRDTAREAAAVRRALGVVFQAPAIDRRLTVRENLAVHGALYGLSGRPLAGAIALRLEQFGLADRHGDLAGTLSGGLLRRVEIAKALLHRPRLMLLDEPSTGLDPAARADLWEHLSALRDRDGVTVLFTTHLLEEAERADRVAILHEGKVVADGAPRALTAAIGGEVLVIRPLGGDPAALRAPIEAAAGVAARTLEGTLRLEAPDLHRLVPRIIEAAPGRIDSITLGRPTLFDVFAQATGRRFERAGEGG